MFQIGPFQYTFKKNEHSYHSELPPKKIFCFEKIIISERELVVITGPSGSGKSTLLQILKGIIPEYTSGNFEGEVLYNNNPLDGENFKKNLKKILFLFQNPFSQLIYPNVAEEFFFSMENFNFTRQQMDQKKEELNKIFNLDTLWNKKTIELSNGECQRLVLASLLAIDPDALLLDEPTAFLDPEARSDFYQWLKKIKGTKTIVLVDHHLSEILPLVDKVIHVSVDGAVSLGSKTWTPISPKTGIRDLPLFSSKNSTLSKTGIKKDNIKFSLFNIFFHYPNQTTLIEDVSLSFSSGEIAVVKGKNGKGKSSLFKIMIGILKPQKGKVQILKNGVPIAIKNHYKEIGFIFQNPEAHFFYDTIREELGKIEENVPELKMFLEIFFKDIDLSRSPFLLSEGEKRRLSLIMNLFLDKAIFLYDEPTFGQDYQSIENIIDMIKYLKDLGKIQIIISHDEYFINAIADKVYNLEGGKCVRLK